MEKINELGYVRVYLFRKHDHVISCNKVTKERITPHNNSYPLYYLYQANVQVLSYNYNECNFKPSSKFLHFNPSQK